MKSTNNDALGRGDRRGEFDAGAGGDSSVMAFTLLGAGSSAGSSVMAFARPLAVLLLLQRGDGAAQQRDCATDVDCFLNGICIAGTCSCHAGWTGIHCGQFDFLPTPPGPLGGKAFPPEADSSTWGTSVIKGRDGLFHMYLLCLLGNKLSFNLNLYPCF